jgi:ribosomal protein L35
MLEHKSAKRKRGYAQMHAVDKGSAKSVRQNAPYLKG